MRQTIFLMVLLCLAGPALGSEERIRSICLEDAPRQQEFPPIVLGCELIGCFPGFEELTDRPSKFRLHVQFHDEFDGELVLDLPDSPEISQRWEAVDLANAIEDGLLVTREDPFDLQFEFPATGKRSASIRPRIQRKAPVARVGKSASERILANLSVDQYLIMDSGNEFLANSYKERVEYVPCLEPLVDRRREPQVTTQHSGDRIKVTGHQCSLPADCPKIALMVRGFDAGADKCHRQPVIYRQQPTNSDPVEFEIFNLSEENPKCPGWIAAFSQKNAPKLRRVGDELLPSTSKPEYLPGIELSEILSVDLTIVHDGERCTSLRLEEQALCEVAAANDLFGRNLVGLRLDDIKFFNDKESVLNNLCDSKTSSIGKDVCGFSIETCDFETSSEEKAFPMKACEAIAKIEGLPNGLIAYYDDRLPAVGFNCGFLGKEYRRINYIGRFTSPATLAHEIGHSLSLCHTCGTSSDKNLMAASRLERNLTLEQVFWMNFSHSSYIDELEALYIDDPEARRTPIYCLNDTSYCLPDDDGQCQELPLEPPESCRLGTCASKICPAQLNECCNKEEPPPIKAFVSPKLVIQELKEIANQLLRCADCTKPDLTRFTPEQISALTRFILTNRSDRSPTEEFGLSQYLEQLHQDLGDRCRLSKMRFGCAYWGHKNRLLLTRVESESRALEFLGSKLSQELLGQLGQTPTWPEKDVPMLKLHIEDLLIYSEREGLDNAKKVLDSLSKNLSDRFEGL